MVVCTDKVMRFDMLHIPFGQEGHQRQYFHTLLVALTQSRFHMCVAIPASYFGQNLDIHPYQIRPRWSYLNVDFGLYMNHMRVAYSRSRSLARTI